MINWTIKIQSPILTLGMSFQVKYRKLPSTNWVSFSPNPTTNEFTIPNLENGDYEAEIRTICTNGELSSPVYHSTVNVPGVLSASIVWGNYGTEPRSGTQSQQMVLIYDLDENPSDPILIKKWQLDTGAGFVDVDNGATPFYFTMINGNNKMRLFVESTSGQQSYSNVLEFTKSVANIYISNQSSNNLAEGSRTYKLNVENQPFTGYVILRGQRSSNMRGVQANGTHADPLTVPNNTDPNVPLTLETAVTLPVGIYDCTLQITGVQHSPSITAYSDGFISYSLDNNFDNGICFADAHREISGEVL